MTIATGQLTVDLLFGLRADRASREFAALGTREQSTVAETLQDHHDRDRLVAVERAMGRVERLARQHAVVRDRSGVGRRP